MADQVLEKLDVSRETLEKLKLYESLLASWSNSINLVSKKTIPDIWNRHILDSAQLAEFIDPEKNLLDIGSGGGLPAIVIGAISQGQNPLQIVTAVESDARKVAFLRTAARKLELNVNVINRRVELIPPLSAPVLTARAMTSLNGLLQYVELHRQNDGLAIFPKGRSWRDEIKESEEHWKFQFEAIPSATDADSAILVIKECMKR